MGFLSFLGIKHKGSASRSKAKQAQAGGRSHDEVMNEALAEQLREGDYHLLASGIPESADSLAYDASQKLLAVRCCYWGCMNAVVQ